jgi:hypothetical protein
MMVEEIAFHVVPTPPEAVRLRLIGEPTRAKASCVVGDG